jgi:Family of unknown function (DUF6629)
MCVSAAASFAAGSGLAVVGVATLRRALHHDRSMFVYSMFPLVFSLHQFIEGAVWLSVDGVIDEKIFRYLFIIIAFLLWPILSPLASAVAEKDPRRRAVNYALSALGLMLGGYLAFKLARASGVEVKDIGHSLSYVIGYDKKPPVFTRYAYAALTIIPLLMLRNRVINVMGALVGLCFLYSYFVMRDVWFSVWCLEAAIFSMLVFFSIRPTQIFMASVVAIYVQSPK